MIMALAVPALEQIIQTTRMVATTDILQGAASKTRASAIAQKRSCTLDISRTEGVNPTERVTSSSIKVAEDFERYREGVSYRDDLTENNNWALWPLTAWEIFPGVTRQLRANRGGEGESAYAWSQRSYTTENPNIDVTVEVQVRMKLVNTMSSEEPWGFGLVGSFDRNEARRRLVGYRFAVHGRTKQSGWNKLSRAAIDKIYSPSSAAHDTSVATRDQGVGVYELDDDMDEWEYTATLTPGIWYRMKLTVKREKRVVEISGKLWTDGTPEPGDNEAVFASALDVYNAASREDIPEGRSDNFGQEPLSGGYCGVWAYGAEVAVDDFSVDKRDRWLLPRGVQIMAVKTKPNVSIMDQDIDPSIPKCAVVGPTQIRKLMQLTENTSSDYVRLQQLQQYGMAPGWLGFDWISSTRLLHPTAPGTDIDCLFFTKRAIGMNIPKNITARVQEDPSISFAWRIYCFTVMGAVRVEDEQIVRGAFLDTL